MSSTFFGLTIASSGMNAFQTAVNTTANNISNARTEGYTRQVANRVASEALRVNAKYGTTGSGVTTTSITQVRNSYYDVKYWRNQSKLGFYETKLDYMNQIENYFIDEDATKGFSTIFSTMFNNLDALKGPNASEDSYRKNFIGSAQNLCDYFNMAANGLKSLQEDCNDQIKTVVDNVNSIAQKVAALNRQINSIEIHGGYANELRDQRALLVDELSGILPVTVSETPVTNTNYPEVETGATNYVIKINGQKLVDTFDYNTLECQAREYKVNQTDAEGLYDIKWKDSGMSLNMSSSAMTGSLKGIFDSRDGNNCDNFTGTVLSAGNKTITVDPAAMKTVESMSMAAEGVITIRNKEYVYEGFAANLDADGNIVSYTFNLERSLDYDSSQDMLGKTASIGDSIDAMGIPYYMAQMSEFIRGFAGRFNAYQQSGVDLNGDPMGSFFVADDINGAELDFSDQKVGTDGKTDAASVITSTSNTYYQMTALNFTVADDSLRHSERFSTTASIADGKDAHELVEKMLDLQDKDIIYRGVTGKDFLQCILSDISIDTQEAEIFEENYSDIASTIANQRLSVSGVDEDEEALDLLRFQNAYNLASRMIQTMSEMYDRLILQTGV